MAYAPYDPEQIRRRQGGVARPPMPSTAPAAPPMPQTTAQPRTPVPARTPAAPAPAPAPRPQAPAPSGSPYGDLSGFGSYADWQTANRAAGGPGESADVARHFGVKQAGGSKLLGQDGTGTDEQRRTGALPAGTFPDDSPDAGNANTGDPYLDELRSGRVAGSEDWRRFTNAQLKEWEPFYLGGGKFRTEDGGVAGKPTDTTNGGNYGNTEIGHITKGGGAAAGAGGGAAKVAAGGGALGDGTTQALDLWSVISKGLNGPSRYTPEVMANLLGSIKTSAEAGATNARREALADAAARGMARSTADTRAGGAAMRDIRAKASSQVLQGKNQIAMAKINADYEDKLAALKAGQEWLNSLRSYIASMAGTQAQKEAAMANITLGYSRLNQEMDMMREQYAQRLQSAALGM